MIKFLPKKASLSLTFLIFLCLTSSLGAKEEKTITIYFNHNIQRSQTPTLKIEVEAKGVATEQNVKKGDKSDVYTLLCDGRSWISLSDQLTNSCKYIVSQNCELIPRIKSDVLSCTYVVTEDKKNHRIYQLLLNEMK